MSRDIGYARAVTFYRHAVHRHLWRLGRDRRWRTWLAVNAPGWSGYQCWSRQTNVMPQGEGNLGDRMGYVFDRVPPGPALVIGTDSPQIEPVQISAAFEALRDHDAVFGPSDDGGYWLVGLSRRRAAPQLFDGVRWSTAHSLLDTINSLPPSFSVAMLNELIDVDCGDDHRAFFDRYGPMRTGPWRP